MISLADKRIAVLKGGPGAERAVSLATAAGVVAALRGLGAAVFDLDVRDDRFVLPEDLFIAFITVHGTFGEDGQLQQILESRGIPYTGEGVAASRRTFDKIETKNWFVEKGVATPEFEVIRAGGKPAMPPPYVVKAPKQGSTVGIYIVKSQEEAEAALKAAAAYDDTLLIEKFVAGKELTIGILGDQALPIIQICPKEGFYDFNNKYPFLNPQAGGGAEHLCPAPIGPELTRLVQETALHAHRALDLETYSRVDILLPDSGKPEVLEVNTIPGMTETSLLPEAAGVAGISYGALCERIVELSLAKRRRA